MRKFLYIVALTVIFTQVKAQRNVILIVADDLGIDYCGFYENHKDTIAMPNVRKLLAKGIRFKNAWVNLFAPQLVLVCSQGVSAFEQE